MAFPQQIPVLIILMWKWARLSHWESSGWKEVLAKQYPSNIPTGKVGLGSGFAHVYFDDFLLNNGKTVLQRMDYTYDKEGKRTQSKDKDNNTVKRKYHVKKKEIKKLNRIG